LNSSPDNSSEVPKPKRLEHEENRQIACGCLALASTRADKLKAGFVEHEIVICEDKRTTSSQRDQDKLIEAIVVP